MTKQTKSFKKGFKFPIYPTAEQRELLEKTFGCCRYVYNRGLAEAKQEYEHYVTHREALAGIQPPRSTGYDFCAKLPSYKNDPDSLWLNDVNAVSLQQAMLHLGSAYSRFFRERKGYPRFKKKHEKQSFTLMKTAFRFKDDELYIAKSKDPLKVVYSRELPSEPSQITISKTPSGKYYASFLCEYTPKKTTGAGIVGIDLGIKDFLVSSDGSRYANPKCFAKSQQKLRRLQQSLSRKRKGSCNRTKARLKVAQCHEHIANQRRDFHHKLSRQLVNKNQVIGVEKLMVKNMVKNSRLSKSISDVGWKSFTSMLDYKSAESQQCTIVYMDAFFPSSHLCHIDHHRLETKLKLSERTWRCSECGTVHDRDLNAAINIRDEAAYVIESKQLQDHHGLKILATRRF